MKAVLVLLALVASVGYVSAGQNWALLIAGSNTYMNYRHQSDVCHAWHILHDKGNFPADNIVTMIYDDIAYDPSNPFPGNLINQPNGTNVYTGVVKDYTKDAVTATNFLNVLQGNATAMKGIGSGKVIASGPDDNVFVYYSDHGATGLVAMPTGPYLYANDLIKALTSMAANKQFKQLVFYLEACESGSMFDTILPANINIFATTASNPDESSYAFYYDASRNTYLGDEYSIRWMEDSDKENFATFSLEQQFLTVQNQTVESHVCQYGQMNMDTENIGLFQGYAKTFNSDYKTANTYITNGDAVSSRDVKLAVLMRQAAAATVDAERTRLNLLVQHEIEERQTWDRVFSRITTEVAGNKLLNLSAVRVRDYDCLKASVTAVENKCGRLSDYSLKYVRNLAALCEAGFSSDAIFTAVQQAC